MIDKLSAGMKSWIKQDYKDISENPEVYDVSDVITDKEKIIDLIEEDVNAKFETTIPRTLIEECVTRQ